MPNWIRSYNEATGVANTDGGGYHETITVASIRAANKVLAAHGDHVPLYAIVNTLLAGELGHPDWLLRYWTRARLFSVEARRHWLDPDVTSPP